MRNWHEVHVHCNNKNKEKEKQMLPPNKKILQIDIKHVGGSVIYFKEFKNPKKWGKPFIKWFFLKENKSNVFHLCIFYPHPQSALRTTQWCLKGSNATRNPGHRKFFTHFGNNFPSWKSVVPGPRCFNTGNATLINPVLE